jgi:hypothetical protein
LREDAKRQSYVTRTFLAILPPVKSVTPTKNLFLTNFVLLGSGPLSHEKAAAQGCDVPCGKDLSDSGYVEFGGNEYVSLRKTLEKLQREIGVCLERMALGKCGYCTSRLPGFGPMQASPSVLEGAHKVQSSQILAKAHVVGAGPKRFFKNN